LQNCRGNLLESVAYAARSAIARRMRLFVDNVTTVIALNDFMGRRLQGAGFRPDQIVVLPNMVELAETPADAALGQYAAFSGRISTEKGIDTLLAAAAQTADVPVHLAGGGPLFDEMSARAGDNVTMRGQLKSEQMAAFYRNARFLVLPTACFEGCPLVISEAMNHGLPVVASRIGGLPELVEDGVTGFLFEPGNAAELAHKIKLLWDSPALCTQMGLAGRAKAEREFGERAYHDRLLEIYRGAIDKMGGKTDQRNTTPPAAAERDLVTMGSANSESYKTYN
jgi:glycosyltransferase involved in cell wall biosynthesis